MELDIKPTSILKDRKKIDGGHSVNLYKNPPDGQLAREDCEDLFRQRLEAYAIIEKADRNLGDLTNSLRQIKSYIYKTNCIIQRVNDAQQRRLDNWSHMLMRLYCIHQSNLWTWFKTCESRLFKYRLRDIAESLSAAQMEGILISLQFDFQRVIGVELNEVRKERIIGWDKPDKGEIFKVKFTDALYYLSKRSVGLKDGFAYLTKHDIISIACTVFEKQLDSELIYARQRVNFEDPQIHQLIESMDLVYQDYQERIGEERRKAKKDQDGDRAHAYAIDLEDLDQIVKDHYPPCMRYVQETLSQDNHLKHQARLHYGTFLKSAGVDMDSALEFWRKEFTKKIANDKFERDYKYNIRHLYGKEGNKKGLSCFSCDKIIKSPPGPSEKHGCPFQNFDEAHLRPMLAKHGLKDVDIDSVMIHKNNKDYTMACTHYFEYRKGHKPTSTIYSPINFYYESRRAANLPPPSEQEQEDPPKVENTTTPAVSGDNIEEGTDMAWED